MAIKERTTLGTTTAPSRDETARRVVIFIFGIVQAIIGLRIVLLLFDARESNGLVSAILDLSQILVAPFEGILRTNAMTSGGSILDVAAIVALIGWTLIELLVIAAIGIFQRQPARA